MFAHPESRGLHRPLLAVLTVSLLAGCAAATPQNRFDPYEPVNRRVHAFNDAADRVALDHARVIGRAARRSDGEHAHAAAGEGAREQLEVLIAAGQGGAHAGFLAVMRGDHHRHRLGRLAATVLRQRNGGRYRELYDRQHGLEQNLFLAPGEGDSVPESEERGARGTAVPGMGISYYTALNVKF